MVLLIIVLVLVVLLVGGLVMMNAMLVSVFERTRDGVLRDWGGGGGASSA